MKYGFLFGAGAEMGYGLPSGGRFALDIFRHDSSKSKQEFKDMRGAVDTTTNYAYQWLPADFRNKNISSFGRSVFQNIITDTIGNNRTRIIEKINRFDEVARAEEENLNRKKGVNVTGIIEEILDRKVDDIHLGQNIAFIPELAAGNELFNSSYFSALLMLYKKKDVFSAETRKKLGKILLSIIQFQIGALGEALSHKINDSVFSKKDDEIDIFDDIGEIIQLNYSLSGLSGMEYLLDKPEFNGTDDETIILQFAHNILESIYASVLDYKSLIDANWHYLYSPASDWAKFCKICIFLLNVRDYISGAAKDIDFSVRRGYYQMLREALDAEKFEVSAIATTNYNHFIVDLLKKNVVFLNGSTELWYDPYLNRIGEKDKLSTQENHILVPLIFTQSGTKPITSIEMSSEYVDTYRAWKESDAIVIVGFGFGQDDEHINGILRTLVDVDDRKLIIVTLSGTSKEIAQKLKVRKKENIQIVIVDRFGATSDEKQWTEVLAEQGHS